MADIEERIAVLETEVKNLQERGSGGKALIDLATKIVTTGQLRWVVLLVVALGAAATGMSMVDFTGGDEVKALLQEEVETPTRPGRRKRKTAAQDKHTGAK